MTFDASPAMSSSATLAIWASRGRIEAARLALRRAPARSPRAVRGREHHVAIPWRSMLADARRPAVESVLRMNQHYHDSAEMEITTIFSRPTASSPASSNVLVAKRRAGARCQINLLTRPGR